jgi:hypothetical protein
MESSHPQWVWYGGGMLCVIAAFGFLNTKIKSPIPRNEPQAEGSESL